MANSANAPPPKPPKATPFLLKTPPDTTSSRKASSCASECPARFQTFIDSFYAEFKPSTPTQTELVDTMATARWRIIRMSNLEAAIIDHEYAAESDPTLTTPARVTLAYRRATDSGRSIEHERTQFIKPS